jgi:hypothetical protein
MERGADSQQPAEWHFGMNMHAAAGEPYAMIHGLKKTALARISRDHTTKITEWVDSIVLLMEGSPMWAIALFGPIEGSLNKQIVLLQYCPLHQYRLICK